VIRFAWLQSRSQTVVVFGALAALAVAATITGIHLSHLYTSDVARCQTGCDLAINQFLRNDSFLRHSLDILALITPALIGIFWGAPLLARELETGTYRLAWTQSVSRSRWLVTKLGLVGVITITVAGLLTLTITWWYRTFDTLDTNQYAVFDRRGIAPIGYAVFAFAAGALIGVVLRRALPAMATTLGVYVFARIATAIWIRPHLLSPLHKIVSLHHAGELGFISNNGSPITLVAKGSGGLNTWTLSSHIVTSTGHMASAGQLSAFVHHYCPRIAIPPPISAPANHPVKAGPADAAAFNACRNQAARIFHVVVTYQPAGRYWTFQWIETGIFIALALLATIGCYWWVTKRSN
jgi:ABC-type transport system involved in multi-copper enzyme maturation permease subunit